MSIFDRFLKFMIYQLTFLWVCCLVYMYYNGYTWEYFNRINQIGLVYVTIMHGVLCYMASRIK